MLQIFSLSIISLYAFGTLAALFKCRLKSFGLSFLGVLSLILCLIVYSKITGYSTAQSWKEGNYLAIFFKGTFEEFSKVFVIWLIAKLFNLNLRTTITTLLSFVLLISIYENLVQYSFLYASTFSNLFGFFNIKFSNLPPFNGVVEHIGYTGFFALLISQFLRILVHFYLCYSSLLFIRTKQYQLAFIPVLGHGLSNLTLAVLTPNISSVGIGFVIQLFLSLLIVTLCLALIKSTSKTKRLVIFPFNIRKQRN